MLNAVMSQYARINNLKMPSMFREPIDIKKQRVKYYPFQNQSF